MVSFLHFVMCTGPVVIKNPNLGISNKPGQISHDDISRYIQVPCGHCPQCIALDQMYLVQRIIMECMVCHPFFCTLTYNNEHLPVFSTSTGYDIRYSSIRDLQLMFKRLREHDSFGRPFKYLYVTERGSKKARPHIHLIWLLPKYDHDNVYTPLNLEAVLYKEILSNWVTNVGTDKFPVYEPNCTFVRKLVAGRLRYNYDLHWLNPGKTASGVSEVGFYVLKYMLKRSSHDRKLQQALRLNLSEEEYMATYNVVKSRWMASKGFGRGSFDKSERWHPKVLSYLHSCVDRTSSLSPYPCFFNPFNGSSFPMAPFYKNDLDVVPMSKQLVFDSNRDPYISPDPLLPSQIEDLFHNFDRIQKLVESHDTFQEIDNLFE